jgi:hypothetical protein
VGLYDEDLSIFSNELLTHPDEIHLFLLVVAEELLVTGALGGTLAGVLERLLGQRQSL